MAHGLDIKGKIKTALLIVIFGAILFALGGVLSTFSTQWAQDAGNATYDGHAMVATLMLLLPFLWYAGVAVAIVLAIVMVFF